MVRLVFFLLACLHSMSGWAQHSPADSLAHLPIRLRDAFLKGRMQGSFRTFFMATDNAPGLSDPYALAVGGGLHFETAPWRGFGMGIGGAFNFNLLSTDLSQRDPATNAANRYEIGLFDVENPQNRHDLDRLEELWLRYAHRRTRITLGQQLLQTPFVNYQDGRMRPTAEKGIWMEYAARPHTRIQGGWLWQMSPRSTVRWYSVSTSIGLYPQGLNPDGSKSGYQSQLSSRGIGLLGITHSWGERLKVQAWDQYVENIFNTAFAQVDYEYPLNSKARLLLGLQFTHQNALHDGGHPDVDKTYFQPGSQSNVLSAQMGWRQGQWQAITAYTRVTADGRFLSPREWGREPFYTFMSRERIEGSGDSHSITGRLRWQGADGKLRLEAAYGHFCLPDVKNTILNKYAFPSFRQLNLEARYTFQGALQGLQAQLLYVWKGRIGDVYDRRNLIIHRVNMAQYNLVLNYLY